LITLHSVSKSLGRGRSRRLVLNDISWSVQPREHYVILGQKGAGKSTLLNVMSGARIPSSGWVERKGAICPGRHSIIRVGGRDTTPRQLSKQLARLYRVPYEDLIKFVPSFAHLQDALDVPISSLPKPVQQRMNYAFVYAVPFDVYLFDEDVAPRRGPFADACRQAFAERCQDASTIVATSNPGVARKFEGIGGVLHEGKIQFFETVSEAISAFNQLPRQNSRPEFFDTESDDDADDEWS